MTIRKQLTSRLNQMLAWRNKMRYYSYLDADYDYLSISIANAFDGLIEKITAVCSFNTFSFGNVKLCICNGFFALIECVSLFV